MKNQRFNQNILKIHIFDLKSTDHNKYVVELSEILIRKANIKEICVKASKDAKNMFLTRKCIFLPKCQNAQHTPDLDSAG